MDAVGELAVGVGALGARSREEAPGVVQQVVLPSTGDVEVRQIRGITVSQQGEDIVGATLLEVPTQRVVADIGHEVEEGALGDRPVTVSDPTLRRHVRRRPEIQSAGQGGGRARDRDDGDRGA